MKLAVFLLGMMFVLAMPIFGLDIVTKEIKLSDDPVEILDTWAYLEKEDYGEELYCWVEYKNQSDNSIDALSFGILFYDVFNEYLDTLSVLSIEELRPGWTERSCWEPDFYKEWATYTIIVFLHKVRFADGSIWTRSEAEIAPEIKKLKGILFKPERLEEKKKE